MILLIAISFLVLCLTTSRGWLGDILGQIFVGVAVGVLSVECLRRVFCYYKHAQKRKIPLAFTPFLAFGFHVIAFAFIPIIYYKVIVLGALIGAGFWLVSIYGDVCESPGEETMTESF